MDKKYNDVNIEKELINWWRVRALIEHENNLIGARLTWLLSSQAMLLAAYALLYSAPFDQNKQSLIVFPLIVIPFVGSIICFNCYWHLLSARIQISRVTTWWYNTFTERKTEVTSNKYKEIHPPLHFWPEIETDRDKYWLADRLFLRHEAIPIFFIILWVSLLIGGTIHSFYKEKWDGIINAIDYYNVISYILGIITVTVLFLFSRLLGLAHKTKKLYD